MLIESLSYSRGIVVERRTGGADKSYGTSGHHPDAEGGEGCRAFVGDDDLAQFRARRRADQQRSIATPGGDHQGLHTLRHHNVEKFPTVDVGSVLCRRLFLCGCQFAVLISLFHASGVL